MKIIEKLISQNLKPIALIVLTTAVGGLFGYVLTGFFIGLILIALATLFAASC